MQVSGQAVFESNGVSAEIEAYKRERGTGIRLRRTFPLEIYPRWLQSYAHEVAASCEVPVCVVGFGILAMLGACYGVHLQVAIKNRYVPFCHDWFFLIADVSLGKSPIFSHLKKPLDQIQKKMRELLATAEGDEKDVSHIRSKIDDASPESMVKAQSENGGAIALVSGETSLFSKLADPRYPYPLQPYLSGHTGESYDVLRITRGANEVERARLAIFAATQTIGLQETRARREIESKGMIARCSFFIAPDLSEDDFHDDDPEVSEELAVDYERTLRELGIKYRSNEIEPLRFSPEAREARRLWRNRFKRLHRLKGNPLHDISGHASKLEDKVCRWAGLLHVLWCEEDGRRTAGVITLEDWNRALELLGFDLHHYRAAITVIHEGAEGTLTRELQSWLIGKTGELIKERDLRRRCRFFKRAEERTQEKALAELEDLGVIVRFDDSNGKKSSPAIRVVK